MIISSNKIYFNIKMYILNIFLIFWKFIFTDINNLDWIIICWYTFALYFFLLIQAIINLR